MYSSPVGRLLFAARAALLACVVGLAFLMRVCLRWLSLHQGGGGAEVTEADCSSAAVWSLEHFLLEQCCKETWWCGRAEVNKNENRIPYCYTATLLQ